MGKKLAWLIDNCQPGHDECVIWPFSLGPNGYGNVCINYEQTGAHREACRIENGKPPSPDHEAAHSCGNRACINGRHLRWATPAENAADRLIHGTHREGERAGQAKLTNEQAAQIRADNRRQREIAADYGVTQKVICLIKSGRSYKSPPRITP
ncbi:HNH endonuclease [Paracoccus sp. SY]|uniref:HNH endonuclease n=1 Tax=Paracoccus sp. SY TaxID=1330255 RepID=UPI00130487E7|nr:HNH endonuclease [Paracoccus sp. SY]